MTMKTKFLSDKKDLSVYPYITQFQNYIKTKTIEKSLEITQEQ